MTTDRYNVIDQHLQSQQLEIDAKVKAWIDSHIQPSEVKLWYFDGCPFDSSGIVKDAEPAELKGLVQSAKDLFSKTYTGQWTPTYQSGMGKIWHTVWDEYVDAVHDILWSHLPAEDDQDEKDGDAMRANVVNDWLDDTCDDVLSEYDERVMAWLDATSPQGD